MKVLIAIALAIGTVSALGSGPYLPSGWRPDGPAFYLPPQPRKPVVNPLQDVIFQGSEASGSNFLREYGPPKLQSLPSEVTEQTFVVLEAKFAEDEGVSVEAVTEAITELRSALVEELAPTTEAKLSESVEEVTAIADVAEVEEKSLNLEVEVVKDTEVESATEKVVEVTEADEKEDVSSKIQTEVKEEIKTVEEEVKNIAEAIVNLENIKVAQQVQISQDITEFKSAEQNSGAQIGVPEGFLEYVPPGFQEYGPPGFKEYGPPKEDLLRNESADKSENEKIENNETRRRRFSPKFRSTKKY